MSHKPPNRFVSFLKPVWQPLQFFIRPFLHNPYESLPRSLQPQRNFLKLRVRETCHTTETNINNRIGFLGVKPL
ncbi:hypothetical protein CR513_11171, partial [Mucuna pruriens]